MAVYLVAYNNYETRTSSFVFCLGIALSYCSISSNTVLHTNNDVSVGPVYHMWINVNC